MPLMFFGVSKRRVRADFAELLDCAREALFEAFGTPEARSPEDLAAGSSPVAILGSASHVLQE